MIRGLREAHARRIEDARARGGPFASVAQVQRRAGLPKHALQRLAEADAFGSLGLSRREALWQVLALDDAPASLFDWLEEESDEATERRSDEGEGKDEALSSPSSLRAFVAPPLPPALPAMPLGQEVMTDYATAGLSLKRHPVALVRDVLARAKLITAAELQQSEAGRWVRVAGLVLIRQRPGTASGIVFATLEDETGVANLIIRPDAYDRYRPAARHATLLRADGYVERQGQVVHVMVRTMEDLSGLLEGYAFKSRDFH